MSSRGEDPHAPPDDFADEVEREIAACLEQPEAEWENAVERACVERPPLRSALRRRFALLVQAGVAESSSADGALRTHPVEDFPPGAVGHYTILERLGGGGMGLVFLAQDARDGRRVALKMVRPDQLLLPTSRERFRREVEIVSRLDHPSIVRIFEVGEHDGVPWYAMEWLKGCSLAQVVRSLESSDPATLDGTDVREIVSAGAQDPAGTEALGNPGEEPDAAEAPAGGAAAADPTASPGSARRLFAGKWCDVASRVALHVADALSHAHEHAVLHRDVKPSNIMLTPDGRVVLVDFGLARDDRSTQLTQAGAQVGSLPYLAPEQIRDPARSDVGTDVYSLGVCLYESLGLRSPFLSRDLETTRQRILAARPEPLQRLNRALRTDLSTVVQCAMDEDAARRYASADDLRDDLARTLRRQPIAARRPSTVRRIRRFVQLHPIAAAAALVVLTQVIVLQFIDGRRLADQRDRNEESLVATRETLDLVRSEAGRAAEARRLAEQAMESTRSLLDRQLLRLLPSEADLLFPLNESILPAIDGWMRRADEQLGRKGEIEARVKECEVRLQALDANDPQRAQIAEELDLLRGDLERLEVLQSKRAAVIERRRVAAQLRTVTIEAPDVSKAWKDAIEEIFLSDLYGGLEIVPQLGLVPLGPDPESGLWEFWQVSTGERPHSTFDSRLKLKGRWAIRPETGVVLVLIPGQRFSMGARPPRSDRELGQPNVDPDAARYEGPPLSVDLDPYFLSKYEITLPQWFRWQEAAFKGRILMRDAAGLALPVGYVDYYEALAWVKIHSLALPTEAQWECAMRGGTHSVYFSGDEVSSLAGFANLAGEERGRISSSFIPDLRDAYLEYAAVCTLAANPYGLHHVIGNVAEWCLDPFLPLESKDLPPQPGDGLRMVDGPVLTPVLRGGSFADVAMNARAAARDGVWGMTRIETIGLRPVRRIEE